MLTKFKTLSFKTKMAVGATTVAASLAAGGAAFAYITGGSGTGNGTATGASSLTTDLTVAVGSPTITPGASPDASVSVSVSDAKSYSVHFNGAIAAIAAADQTSAAACGVTLTGTKSWTGGFTATPTTAVTLSGLTIDMADNATGDTTSCEGKTWGAVVTLS